MQVHSGEPMLLKAKLSDMLLRSEKRSGFMGFLNEHEQLWARDFLRHRTDRYLFWGGHADAERGMLGFFPDFLDPDPSLFPIAALTMRFRKQDVLSHRDLLGSLMALGIRRETVGDILLEPGRSVVFLKQEILPFVQDNIRKIGSAGVQISEGFVPPLPPIHRYEELRGVIASDRLDCMTAFLMRTSREKAAALIKSGMVMKNHRELLSLSERVAPGDILSIKTRGKFLVDQLGPKTAKGRLSVTCRKYI